VGPARGNTTINRVVLVQVAVSDIILVLLGRLGLSSPLLIGLGVSLLGNVLGGYC